MCIFEFCQKRRNGHLRALIGYRSCNGFERKCVWLQVASFTVAANDLSCPPSAWRRSFSGGASFSVGGPSAFCPLPSAFCLAASPEYGTFVNRYHFHAQQAFYLLNIQNQQTCQLQL